jgi:ribosomal protein S19E (S16A)
MPITFCEDGSKTHLDDGLGLPIFNRLDDMGWIVRTDELKVRQVSPEGEAGLDALLIRQLRLSLRSQ